MGSTELKQLVGQLTTTEMILERLFIAEDVKMESTVVMEKLRQLESFIWQIPKEEKKMLEQWSGKVAGFWKRYQLVKKMSDIEINLIKLSTIESVIEKLMHRKPQPTALLKEKLHQLEELISRIPNHTVRGDLLGQWQGKLGELWVELTNSWLDERYHGMERRQLVDGMHQNWPAGYASDGEADDESELSNYQEDTGRKRARNCFEEPKESNPNPVNSCISAPDHYTEIRSTFVQLRPIAFPSDLDGLKHLLQTMSRAGKYMLQHVPDGNTTQRKKDFFDLAFEKLPLAKRDEFTARFGFKYPWNNLARFLSVNCIASAMAIKDGLQVNSGREYAGYTCCYCQTINGHKSNYCPYQAQMLCVKCYEFNHIAKFCKNGP